MRALAIGFLGLQLAAGQAADSTREISTEELARILVEKSATVLDTRPSREYAISHIPGAVNVAPKPGVLMSMYVSDVAEIGRLVRGNKAAPLVLYCNGLHCGKSKRLAGELLDAGHTDVRREQAGGPAGGAARGVCEMERGGSGHGRGHDGPARGLDARAPAGGVTGWGRGGRAGAAGPAGFGRAGAPGPSAPPPLGGLPRRGSAVEPPMSTGLP